jgi:hypothetical protein
MRENTNMKNALGMLSALVGLLLVIAAFVYFITPANHLPHFLPGFEAGYTKTHFKHGIGALCLGLACFAFAWFQTGKSSPK